MSSAVGCFVLKRRVLKSFFVFENWNEETEILHDTNPLLCEYANSKFNKIKE